MHDDNTIDLGPEPAFQPPMQTTTLGQFAAAMAKAQGQMRHAIKDSVNPHFKNNYADLASVIDASRHALAANGIAVIQRPLAADKGVCIQTMLVHGESGEFIADAGLYLPASKQDAQGYGSAMTYARRYGLAALVGVAQDDDDGNGAAATAPKAAAAPKAKAAPKKLTKAQADKLRAMLAEAEVPEDRITGAIEATKPEQFDRAVARAQEMIDERNAAVAEAQEAPAGVNADTGEVH